MNSKEAIKILHDMQKWRRGNRTKMPHEPETFGKAIDRGIQALRFVKKMENRVLEGLK